MNEQKDSTQSEQGQDKKQGSQGQPPTGNAWEEVGRQFSMLGQSLSDAFRASWNDPANQRRMQAMQADLEKMVRDVDQAIQDGANTPAGKRARDEAQKAADTLRDAGEQTAQDVRPHLLNALKQVNEELRKLVNYMESGGKESGGNTPPPGAGTKDEEKKP